MDFQCSRLDIFGTMDNALYRRSWYAIRVVLGARMNMKLPWCRRIQQQISENCYVIIIKTWCDRMQNITINLTEPRLAMKNCVKKHEVQIWFCPFQLLLVVAKLLQMLCCQAIKQPAYDLLSNWSLISSNTSPDSLQKENKQEIKKGCLDIRRPQETADILDMLLIIHGVFVDIYCFWTL